MEKYKLFIATCGLMLLLPQALFSAQDSYIGDTAIYGGSSVSVNPNVLIVFDTSGSMGGTVEVETCESDGDSDGIADNIDNCPNIPNADQSVNPCDPTADFDSDGIPNSTDNCVATYNPSQEDNNGNDDGDGIGDACEVAGGGYNSNIDYAAMTSEDYCGDGSGNDWSAEECIGTRVYRCVDSEWDQTGFCTEWDRLKKLDVDEINNSDCGGLEDSIEGIGYAVTPQRLRSNNGNCNNVSDSRYYASGNWIAMYGMVNAGITPSAGSGEVCTTSSETKNDIAEEVVSNLIQTTEGVNFGVMRFNGGNGGRFITESVSGQNYLTTIKDMDDIHTGTMTNREALIDIVSSMDHAGVTPLGETLYEAMRYFSGGESYFAGAGTYTSPIAASCQPNYVIVMTDGMAVSDGDVPKSLCERGDCDDDDSGDENSDDSLDDVAWYLYNTDLSGDYSGTQNAKTYTIGFGLDGGDNDAVQLLQDTADNGQGAATGQGKAYLTSSYQDLSSALASIIGEVLNQSSAFVAPVVPTSPENKVYSGQRVYLGFFKPQTSGNWLGNLKKFGLNDYGEVSDKNGNDATDSNGSFLPESVSYWGDNTDAGNVDEGGIGDILANRNLYTNPRQIYTYTGSSTELAHSTNAVTTANTDLTITHFDVVNTAIKNDIINYVHGFDVYDEDIDSITNEQRAWIMGDVLHSKPAIQAYNSYSITDENDTSINQTVIFVGSNDGQLHAFSDADGSELWSFIPPSALPDLQNIGNNTTHEFFIDGSPIIYSYDYDGDGNIGTAAENGDSDPTGITDNGSNDKVILIFNLRRGGGIDTLDSTGSRGSYYALDVTNPLSPKYLWEINAETTTTDTNGNSILTFAEMGESWSEPTLAKIRLGSTDKLIAIIGAGYDNNEDLRFGDNQLFPNTTTTTTSTILPTADAGLVSSSGASSQLNPRGRGVYILELANLASSGQPNLHNTPIKLWEYVYDSTRATGDNPTYSFASSVAPLDYDFDGYIDRFYIGDTGGNMWRFNISAKDTISNWSGKKIFSANPGSLTNSGETPVTNGRKIFYPPSVVQEVGYIGLYFGTGDRPHPLNQGTIDRLYALYDRNIATSKTEGNLVNVTEDNLQASNTTAAPVDLNNCTLTNTSVECTLKNLYDSQYYGWFIKLDQDAGEKMLANPLVFSKVAYFSTFTPNMATSDPCLAGDLGVGKLYALNYKTGEAVFNFDTTNDVSSDGDYDSNENERAKGIGDGAILRRSDRFKTIGSGIPSGVVVSIRSDGSASALVGCGGGLCETETDDTGTFQPLYWIME